MKRNSITDSNGRLNISFWSDFFGVPVFVFCGAGGVFLVYALFPSAESVQSIPVVWPLLMIAVGIALFFVQRRRLRFRTLCRVTDTDAFRAEVCEIMKADGWSITHNNKRFMRALYRSNPLTSTIDMVTLRFAGRTVLYNVINDPDAFRSGFACLLSQCRHGRRLIKRIADFVVRVNAAQMDDVNFVSELK